MKKNIIVVLVLIIIIPLFFYGYYYYSLKKANYKFYKYWYSEEFFPDTYTGVVSEIKKHKNFYVVSISVPNDNDRVYNVCQKKINFQLGDTIVKEREEYKLYKISKKSKKEIEIIFCKK